MKRLILIAALGAALSLSACAPGSGGFFDNPQNDLQIAETGFAAAQVLYNTVCASNPDTSFCTVANMQAANDAAKAVRDAISTAQSVLANSQSSAAQIDIAVQGVQTAIKDFTKLVNDLQAAKAKAMVAKSIHQN